MINIFVSSVFTVLALLCWYKLYDSVKGGRSEDYDALLYWVAALFCTAVASVGWSVILLSIVWYKEVGIGIIIAAALDVGLSYLFLRD